VAVLAAAGLATTGTKKAVASGPNAALRVVEWNVRQAVTENAGDLAPDAIASVLVRDGPPDIVVLPEAARGWPLSGDLDLASWLSRRLNLPFIWSPAAGHQFGTLVLSRLPIRTARVVKLPVAGRSQGRSLMRATLDVGGGEPLTLLATHLQHHNDNASMAARLREVQVILGAWKRAPRTLLVGDFNPRQGDPPRYPPRHPGEFAEIRAFLDAGFTTAQDLTTCSQPTSGRNCSDFVLVTPDLRQELTVDDGVGEFDHRPVRSVIRLA
jgi:endonuclease/exonuclease/phosphatase family metal-dependent hydrolase